MSAFRPEHSRLCPASNPLPWQENRDCKCGLDALRAEVRNLRARVRLARRKFQREPFLPVEERDEALALLDLRKPLPKSKPRRRKP